MSNKEMKAMFVETVQADRYCGHAKEELIAGANIQRAAMEKRIAAAMRPYMKFKEVDHMMFVERFWYFDNEAFKNDLEKFGIEITS